MTSRASLCIFFLNKPLHTEAIPEATMAVSIKKKKERKRKKVGADDFNIVLNMLRIVNANISERKRVTGGVRNSGILTPVLRIVH